MAAFPLTNCSALITCSVAVSGVGLGNNVLNGY